MGDDSSNVGYGKPPEKSRFKKGKSGNPKGRPKGSKNFAAYLNEATRQTIRVTIRGKECLIPKAKAIAMQLTNQASAGNLRAIRDYSQLQVRFDEYQLTQTPPRVLEEADGLTMKNIVDRIRRAEAQPEEPSVDIPEPKFSKLEEKL